MAKPEPKTDEPPNPKLEMWRQVEQTDPQYTKEITGRAYRGTSVNPTYVAMRLTELYGPAGVGWGITILDQRDVKIGEDTVLHRAHVRLWVGSPDKGVEHLGETKTVYMSGGTNGRPPKLMVDDDGAKKSVTDAFVKCASLMGVAADIFLGRWDDSKYQAELAEKFGTAETPVKPGPPPANGRTSAAAGPAPF